MIIFLFNKGYDKNVLSNREVNFICRTLVYKPIISGIQFSLHESRVIDFIFIENTMSSSIYFNMTLLQVTDRFPIILLIKLWTYDGGGNSS